MADLGDLINQLSGAGSDPSGQLSAPMAQGSKMDPLIQQLTTGAASSGKSAEETNLPQQADVKTGSPSLMTNLLYGARQPYDQAATLLAKLFPSQAPSVAAANKSGEEAYQQENAFPGFAGKTAELLGNVATTAPLAYAMPGAGAASLGGRMLSGAASGAATGALQPVDPNSPDFWSQTGTNAVTGGVGGAVAPPLLSGLSRLVNPNAVERVAPLLEKGVVPTPGQILGGGFGRAEEALSSRPVVGDIIRSGRSRALGQFDTGAINDVLAPIGQKLETSDIGRDALVEMNDKVNSAFRSAVPKAGGQLDAQFINDINDIRKTARFTPNAQQFDDLLKSEVMPNVSPTGQITGEMFNNIDSSLGRIVRDNVYGHGVPWQQRQFGQNVQQLQGTLRDWMGRVNPEASADLANAKLAFARQLRVEHAANMAGTGEEPGKFSAAQLLSGVKKYATGPTQLMRGEAVMQPYAEAGQDVLGSKVPDSGTPFRSIMALLSGTMGPAMLGHGNMPAAATSALMAAGMGGLGAAGLYSSPGQRLAATFLARRPGFAQPLADAVRGAGPAGSAAGGIAGSAAGGVLAPWLWGALAPSQ